MPAGAVGAVRPVGAILPTATAAGQSPLIFDPLDNRNPALRINYQNVSRL